MCHATISNPGSPASEMVGTSGTALMRFTPAVLSSLLHTPAPVLQIPALHRVRGRTITLVTPGLLRRAPALGKHVHVWTIDDPDEMHELLDRGVDGLMTDRTDILRSVLVDRGDWRQQ